MNLRKLVPLTEIEIVSKIILRLQASSFYFKYFFDDQFLILEFSSLRLDCLSDGRFAFSVTLAKTARVTENANLSCLQKSHSQSRCRYKPNDKV